MAAPKKPLGAKSDKLWRNAILLAVHRETKDNGRKTNYLTRLAAQLVNKAEAGDVTALREIGDRLDGKAAQSLLLGNEDADQPLTIRWVDK